MKIKGQGTRRMKNLFVKASFEKVPFSNLKYANFDYDYVVSVKNYVGGILKIFLESMLDTVVENSWNTKKGGMYFNEQTIGFILGEIEYFKKRGKWKNG